MNRINHIIDNQEFRKALSQLKNYEKNRIYCKHGMEHLLDVARICYIFCLEEGLSYSKDVVYGAALLHDIGRGLEHETGTPHNETSAAIASAILEDAGYLESEIEEITDAIYQHRSSQGESDHSLKDVLYLGDKLSRICDFCSARGSCNWSDDKKNRGITV